MKKPKLIFSDVDNTLVLSKRGFTNEMVEAFKVCQDNEIEFVMCSGRPTSNLIIEAKELKELGVNLNYVAGFNASELYDLNKKCNIYQYGLNKEEVEIIANTITKLGYDYLFYDNTTIITNDIKNEWVQHEYSITKLEKLVQITEFMDTTKVLGICNPGEGEVAVEKLRAELDFCTITLSTDFFIEITRKGVDKGFGLLKTAELFEIDINDVVCFGDGGNDLGMFKTDAYAIAVDNAVAEVKAHANLIIDSAANDGVAKFIKENFSK